MHIPLPHISALSHLPNGIDLPQISSPAAAGIGVAIAGNILISLALNCQKLAHRRLDREREAAAQAPRPLVPTDSNGHLPPEPHSSRDSGSYSPSTPTQRIALLESAPLLEHRAPHSDATRPWFFFRRAPRGYHAKEVDRTHLASTHALMPVEVVPVHTHGPTRQTAGKGKKEEPANANESDYLKSKLWWFGFLLMNLGEMGNFISYAFAPASVVAPLGTFALIANCIFAPVMLKERFRKRDFLGILIAIIGAVTVVLSANPSDTRLDPDALIKAITQRPFEVYAIVYVVGIIILSGLSEGPAGKRWVYIDVGLCALFGGFTVLSTKAVSTLLTMEWFEIFTEWITYPVIAVLLGTGIGQIRYLNRALMRFDSKIVVPTQFVLFNLSAIVGSAILYGDFKQATFHQLVTFLYGCSATFAGVFIIAWAPATPSHERADEDEADEDDNDDDDDDDTIDTATIGPSEPPSNRPTTISLSDDGSGTVPSSVRGITRTGSLGARRARARPALLISDGPSADAEHVHIVRHRHSIVSLYGFSPAQRVLLISSSPREEFVRPSLGDVERDAGMSASVSPASSTRRRAVSWLDDAAHSHRETQANPHANTGASPRAARTRHYGSTPSTSVTASNATSREQSRTGERERVPLQTTRTRTRTRSGSRDRSSSPDPFV